MNRRIVLGLRANWQQFTLLVIVNAFVGAIGCCAQRIEQQLIALRLTLVVIHYTSCSRVC